MKTHLYQASTLAALALALTACDKKNDAISEAAKADKAAGIDAPSIEEVKAIAEEAIHLRPADRDELCSDAGVLG